MPNSTITGPSDVANKLSQTRKSLIMSQLIANALNSCPKCPTPGTRGRRCIMGLKSSLRGLSEGWKGLTTRHSKTAVPEKPAPALVYEVSASAIDEDGTGLTPPPDAMAAPWVTEHNTAPEDSKQAEQPTKVPPSALVQQPQCSNNASSKREAEKQATAAMQSASRHWAARPAERRIKDSKSSVKPTKLHKRQEKTSAATAYSAEAVSTASNPGLESAASPDQEEPDFQLPPAILLNQLLQREDSKTQTGSEGETPLSGAGNDLESVTSTGTVIVTEAHQAKLSLSLTASIEDYAKKADPVNWAPAKFKKSQFVRVQPGTYPVPFKKLSESRNHYTNLHAYTKGTIHQIHKETETRDPREFVTDEGLVLYRVWVPHRVNSDVEFIFVDEQQMTIFRECTFCSAFATEQCGGCKKAWYCSEECLADDWRNHRHDCKHKGRTPPALGERSTAESSCSETPASSITPRPAAVAGPRRKFRDDGTVKIINGYKPLPEELRGRTTIMPACLRPLTVEEEMAPLPMSRTARLFRAASHRLRRALHKRSSQQEEEGEAQSPQLCNDPIPEGDREGTEDSDTDQSEQTEPEDNADASLQGEEQPQAETDNTASDRDSHSNRPEGQEGVGDSMDGQGHAGSSATKREEQPPNGTRHSAGSRMSMGSRAGSRGHRHSSEAPRSQARKKALHALKSAKSLVVSPSSGKQSRDNLQVPHSDLGSTPHAAASSFGQGGTSCIISGACSEWDDGSSPLASIYDDDTGSPGAESLVEGQPPCRRERRRLPDHLGASNDLLMPHLPRIRVRPQGTAPQAAILPASSMKTPQPWPVATAAPQIHPVLRKSGSDNPQPPRSDSLPEVFKRLISGNKQDTLSMPLTKGGTYLSKGALTGHGKSQRDAPSQSHHTGK